MKRGSPTAVTATIFTAFSALALAACDGRKAPEPEPTPTGSERSIFQPEYQVETGPEPEKMGSLETVVRFPDGTELSEAALAELASVIASPQAEAGRPIILRGHSDAGGSDEANLRASQSRAESVRDWMVENGISEDRITIIAFGEQNPVQPNALPDGSPNEEGRAANRRVEIVVLGDDEEASDQETAAGEEAEGEPTLIEALTSPTPTPAESRTTD